MSFAYVGGYTEPDRNGRGEGIYVYRMDDTTGRWEPVQVLGGVKNPSFLALSRDGRFLYAVNGGDAGGASALARDPATGKLALLNTVSVRANNPAHIAVDATGRYAVTANYSAGSVSVVPIGPDGQLGEPTDVRRHEGPTGPSPRQDGSHPHMVGVAPGGRFLLVNDLGLDKTFVYTLDLASGRLVPNDPPYGEAPPGAGPRHLAFHPNGRWVYVINELASTISQFAWDDATGRLEWLAVVSTLPAGFEGSNSTAQIVVHPNGRCVYGSNRGHDSIAIFRVAAADGALELVGHEPTQGRTPRNFNVDPRGRFLYAANQDSDTVVAFRIEEEGARLLPTGQVVRAGSPSCVIFAA
ncbi:MAG TPA: lactonase family protein [Chloroflexota bacterium]|nr:lactonase family protein [Chloroflexota bacterium]